MPYPESPSSINNEFLIPRVDYITFDELVKAFRVTSEASQASALKVINRMPTMRNWLIGYHIVEFEQKGKEKSQGQKLLKRLEVAVNQKCLAVTLLPGLDIL